MSFILEFFVEWDVKSEKEIRMFVFLLLFEFDKHNKKKPTKLLNEIKRATEHTAHTVDRVVEWLSLEVFSLSLFALLKLWSEPMWRWKNVMFYLEKKMKITWVLFFLFSSSIFYRSMLRMNHVNRITIYPKKN